MYYLCGMTNDYITYMSGMIAGIYLLQCISYSCDRNPKAPFRRAFGWTAGASLVVLCIEEVLMRIGPDLDYDLTAVGFFDMMIIPMYWLEVTCIVRMSTETWTLWHRLKQVAVFEAPLLMLALFTLTYPTKLTNGLFFVSLGVYVIFFMTDAIRQLIRYERSLSELQKRHDTQHITWIWKLFAVYALLCLSYLLCFTGHDLWFYPLWIACIIAHGYFIDRQKPIDLTSMYQQQYAEAQEQALKDITDITSQLKRRVDLDMSIATFKVKHPTFAQDLQQMTDTRLTKRDLYLCLLIYEGKKSPEVARDLAISQASVDVARCRLRIKLGLDKGTHLSEAIRRCIDHQTDDGAMD